MLLITLPTSNKKTAQAVLEAFGEDLEHVEVNGIKGISDLYAQGIGIIGICASGILIRAVAGVLSNKKTDPPLLAIADDASVVVPLLGGHHGANEWAQSISKAIGAVAAITTASDVTLKFNFEQPPPSLRLISSAGAHKSTVARILKGAGINLQVEGYVPMSASEYLNMMPNVNQSSEDKVLIYVGHMPPAAADLVYIPKTTVLGVGASRNCPPEELKNLALSCLSKAGLHPKSVAGVFSHQVKNDEVAVLELATFFGVKAGFYSSETLNKHKEALSQKSEIIFREVGVWGVAEAAALEAAGSPKKLTLTKHKTAMATCAIAQTTNHIPN